MKEMDEKIVNLLLDLVNESKKANEKFDRMEGRLGSIETKLESIENQLYKNNAAIGELRISVIRLAEENLRLDSLELRVKRIEDDFLRRAS